MAKRRTSKRGDPWWSRARVWGTSVALAMAGFLGWYSDIRSNGKLFVCDLAVTLRLADWLSLCATAEPAATDIPPLEKPESLPRPVNPVPLRVARVLQGKPASEQSRIFDVTLENGSAAQLVLDNFRFRWQYFRGALSTVAQAAVITPTVAHSIEIRIDPSDPGQHEISQPVTPTIVLPSGSPDEPSVHVFRLELLYVLEGSRDYHTTSDWNIEYSLELTTTDGQEIPIFEDALWREME